MACVDDKTTTTTFMIAKVAHADILVLVRFIRISIGDDEVVGSIKTSSGIHHYLCGSGGQ